MEKIVNFYHFFKSSRAHEKRDSGRNQTSGVFQKCLHYSYKISDIEIDYIYLRIKFIIIYIIICIEPTTAL